jgi:hypothetical protein
MGIPQTQKVPSVHNFDKHIEMRSRRPNLLYFYIVVALLVPPFFSSNSPSSFFLRFYLRQHVERFMMSPFPLIVF